MKKLIFILCLLPIMALGQYTFTDAGTSITISGEGQRFAFEKAGLAIFKYPPNIILSSQGHAYKWHWETIDSPSYSTIDSLFTELQSWLLSAIVVEYYWDLSGDTIRTNYHVQIDSTAIFNSFTAVDGTFSGTITDGTTSIAGGDLTGTNTIDAVKVEADTLTDGVGTLTAGALSGITTIDASGDITVTGADISGDSAKFSHYGGHSPFDIGTDDSTLISFTGTGIEISGDITLDGNIIGGSVTLCDDFLYESGFDTVLYDDFGATYAFVICDTALIEQLCEEYIDPENEYSVILPEIYVYGLTDTVHLTSNDANIIGYDYGEGVYLDCEEEICFVLYIDQGDFNEELDYFGFMVPVLESTPTIIPYITGVNTITFADESEQTTAWTGELPSDITGVNTITFADETEQTTAWTGILPSPITVTEIAGTDYEDCNPYTSNAIDSITYQQNWGGGMYANSIYVIDGVMGISNEICRDRTIDSVIMVGGTDSPQTYSSGLWIFTFDDYISDHAGDEFKLTHIGGAGDTLHYTDYTGFELYLGLRSTILMGSGILTSRSLIVQNTSYLDNIVIPYNGSLTFEGSISDNQILGDIQIVDDLVVGDSLTVDNGALFKEGLYLGEGVNERWITFQGESNDFKFGIYLDTLCVIRDTDTLRLLPARAE